MKGGALINTVFPSTKWRVNYCTISGTRHLNKYLIMLEQNTCMFDRKYPSQFWVNANGICCAINEGGVALHRGGGRATYNSAVESHHNTMWRVWQACSHKNVNTTTWAYLEWAVKSNAENRDFSETLSSEWSQSSIFFTLSCCHGEFDMLSHCQ